ncbi:MAG TPA: hypothetical protein VM290_11280 [Gaiellaceae bacterium]|nr:hypothetical protein [Gaiellaceae bacterium]
MGRARAIDEALRDVLELRAARSTGDPGAARRRIAAVERRRVRAIGPSVPKTRAAALLGVSVTAIDRWIARGALPAVARPGTSRAEVATGPLLELAEEVESLRAAGVERATIAAAVRQLAARHRPPRMGERGYFPDHRAERRHEFATTTAAERVAEAIELSRTLTQLSSLAR